MFNASTRQVETEAAGASPSYQIGGQHLGIESDAFTEAIATAHTAHARPRCLCQNPGVEMYVARLAGPRGGYIVKRMPNTGSQHAPACASYEPPADATGLGQVLGSAISEDPATGQTALKLDFPLSKIAGRSVMPRVGSRSDSVASSGTKLSLRGLLHYLWDQAELTRWQPGFAGKRSWGTVRKHLLQAADHKVARGDSLLSRLYIPELFAVDQRDAINSRRLAQWSSAIAAPGKPQRLMLLIAEVKEIVPARYGFKTVVKHVPDQAFALDEQLYRRLGRRFENELALWAASDDIHMLMIATFSVTAAGLPRIAELSLMAVTRQWLPVEDGFEKQLIDRLVREERCFVKGMRYNLGAASVLAYATLTDCEGSAPMLFVGQAGSATLPLQSNESGPTWCWHPADDVMPSLPPRQSRQLKANGTYLSR
jgi:hypothetical protein